MTYRVSRYNIFITLLAISLCGFGISQVSAHHSWGDYHWARQANPFTVKLGDNVSSGWDAYLATASNDWNVSNALDTVVLPAVGKTNPRTCRPTNGRVEVCNSKYGNNGWLGIASIWVNGSHITQSTVKLNDTYFSSKTYNTPEWKNFVMCQEVGHAFGLDHQDENFENENLGSCMDYTNSPASNQHPNQHDYDELEKIYAHLDTITSVSQTTSPSKGNSDDAEEWGGSVRRSRDGRTSLFERDLGGKNKLYTFVVWADPDTDIARR